MTFNLLLSLMLSIVANAHLSRNASHTTITINTSKRYQRFDGMGFSEAFQRSTQIHGSDGLSPENSTRFLDPLFSNSTSMGATILRNGIGSSLSDPYDLRKSIDTMSPGTPDAPPQYDWQGTIKPGFGLDNGQLQLTKDAIARGVRTVYADAWSALGFMKNNRNDSNGEYLCGVTDVECSSGDWRQAYANYFVQDLEYYQDEGIDVFYVGFLNEPDLKVIYASMLSSGEQAASFLEVFHPTLQDSGLKTKIACCDGRGWEEQRKRLTGIETAGAESTLSIVTSHGYSSPLGTPFNTSKSVWQTEWADLEGAHTYAWHVNGSSGEGLTWANHIQQAFDVLNVSAFLHSIGAGNTTTNSALILLDGDTINVRKRLWAFAQWGRTVAPGAVRVEAAVDSLANVTATAFENHDDSVAVQVINNSEAEQIVHIVGVETTSLKAYLTNSEEDFGVDTGRRSKTNRIDGMVPGLSAMSFVLVP